MVMLWERVRQQILHIARSIEIIHVPEQGIWTSLNLSRGQFFGILLSSILLFLFLDGPIWRHLRSSHTERIVGSYGLIPVLVAAAQWKNRSFRPRSCFEASILIAVIKLLATAVLLVLLALLG